MMNQEPWQGILGTLLSRATGRDPQWVTDEKAKRTQLQKKDAATQALIASLSPHQQSIPSPTGPNNPAPMMGNVQRQPGYNEIQPALLGALAAGVDPSAFMNVWQKGQPEKPEEFTLGEGDQRYRGGSVVASNPKAATATQPRAPISRTRIEGAKEIFEELDEGTRQWRKVSEGPRWAPAKSEDGGPGLTDQGILRREFNTEAGSFEGVAGSTVRLMEAAKDPSAAGDLALIFNYMKILDPGSVVRETEFATAQNAAGVPDRIRGMYNRVVNGERLSEDTRKDFVNRAHRLYTGQSGQFEKKVLGRYRDLAKRYGIPEENIIQDYRFDMTPYQSLLGGQQQPQPGQPSAPGPQGGASVRVQSEADYAKLPPGARYVDPNGVERTKR